MELQTDTQFMIDCTIKNVCCIYLLKKRFLLQNLKNQIMTTNLWVEQVSD